MVMAAPAMLIVAPRGMAMLWFSSFRFGRLASARLMGMLAAELRVKKAGYAALAQAGEDQRIGLRRMTKNTISGSPPAPRTACSRSAPPAGERSPSAWGAGLGKGGGYQAHDDADLGAQRINHRMTRVTACAVLQLAARCWRWRGAGQCKRRGPGGCRWLAQQRLDRVADDAAPRSAIPETPHPAPTLDPAADCSTSVLREPQAGGDGMTMAAARVPTRYSSSTGRMCVLSPGR